MIRECENEVKGLHEFFRKWFQAEIKNTEEEYNRFISVLAEEFQLIMPSGDIISREEIIEQIRDGYNSRGDDDTPYRLWIETFDCRIVEQNICVVTYEEWALLHAKRSARRSTAVFRKKEGTVNGVEWVHVHETYFDIENV